MTQSEKMIIALLADAHSAFLEKEWKELEALCLTLAEFAKEMSQKDRDKMIWYRNQTNKDLQ